MSALPVLIVVWAVFTGLFLALLAYNATITRYEENQLFLADINANEQQQQTAIVRRVNRMTAVHPRAGHAVGADDRGDHRHLHLGRLAEDSPARIRSATADVEFEEEPVSLLRNWLFCFVRDSMRCRWSRRRGRRGRSSWCGRTRRAACRRARRCGRRRSRAGPAAGWRAGARCGSRRRTASAVEKAGVGTPSSMALDDAVAPAVLVLVQRAR